MDRRWKPILLAAAGLLALTPAVWGQVTPPVPPPPAAPPEPPVPARIVVVGEGDGFFFQAPAAAPQPAAGLTVTTETGDKGTFFLAQAAAPGTAPRVRVVQEHVDPKAVAAGEYWIGVQLEPLPELVKSQLKLERGMVVVQVFEDSPAAKAELKINDIILRAGDKDIVQPEDLIHAVSEAKDKELLIRALRGGSETTIKITPAKRQADHFELQLAPETRHAEVVQRLEELYKKTPGGDVRLFAVRPGGVLAFAQAGKLPDNLEVTIEKRGEKPATIRVKRIQDGKDQTWEVTEDKVNELPEDIRPHVQQMLGGQVLGAPEHLRLRLEEARARAQDQAAQAQAKMRQAQEHLDHTLGEYRVRIQPMVVPRVAPGPHPPVAPPIGITRLSGASDGSIQAKLDEILKRLDKPQSDTLKRLEKEVERLRKELEELRQEKK